MRGVTRVALFTAEQSAVDALAGGSGEALRAVCRQRWFHLAGLGLRAFGGRGNKLLELGQEGLASGLELDLLKVALAVEHAVGQGLLVGERAQHAMLNGILRDEINDCARARLVLAPGAGDALFQLGGVPRQIAVDDHAGVLDRKSTRL